MWTKASSAISGDIIIRFGDYSNVCSSSPREQKWIEKYKLDMDGLDEIVLLWDTIRTIEFENEQT